MNLSLNVKYKGVNGNPFVFHGKMCIQYSIEIVDISFLG